MDCEKVTENIRKEFKEYFIKHNLKSVVLGISGGIDSCVVAALVRPVCDELGIPLIGRSLPILTNTQNEISNAYVAGKAFCHNFKEVDLASMFAGVDQDILYDEGTLDDLMREKIRIGNIKARCRMIYLYNLAYVHRGLVLSTDNLTEELLGFFTIHGDHCDFAPIQKLWKHEVYEIAYYLADNGSSPIQRSALLLAIEAMPTDGLGVTDGGDLAQIQAKTYDEVDMILEDYVYAGNKTYANHPVVQRYEASHFKRNWPVVITRENLFK